MLDFPHGESLKNAKVTMRFTSYETQVSFLSLSLVESSKWEKPERAKVYKLGELLRNSLSLPPPLSLSLFLSGSAVCSLSRKLKHLYTLVKRKLSRRQTEIKRKNILSRSKERERGGDEEEGKGASKFRSYSIQNTFSIKPTTREFFTESALSSGHFLFKLVS